MNIFKKIIVNIKPKAKYILGVLGIAAVVSQGAFAVNQLSANSPRFNFMNGDFELLRGANQTAGENVWKDPVSGIAGDVFTGIIYYHNGVVDTVAENTRVKINIPANTTGNTASLSATIFADNATTVTDTIVDGQVVGQSGLTVNLDNLSDIEFVPGSVKWYPDQQNNQNIPVSLPFGQTGDEIVSPNGVNLGNINGCWEYAGYVVFSFKTSKKDIPVSEMVKNKNAKNITSGINSVSQIVGGRSVFALNALAGDVIEYTLTTTNRGDAPEDGFVIEDGVADILEYSTVEAISDGGILIDGTSGNEAKIIRYPALGINPGETVTRTFSVRIMNPLPGNPPSGFSYDMQMYNKYGDEVIVFLSRPVIPQPKPILKIEKLVRDFTVNQVDFVDHNESTSGNTLEYLIKFENIGDGPADQINIKDVLPVHMEFIPGTTVISINGTMERTLSDGLVLNGITFDSLSAGSKGYIKFKVISHAGIPAGETLVNTVNLTDDGITISDTAKTTFKAPVVLTPSPKEPLAKTGPESFVIFSITMISSLFLAYRIAKLF